VRSYIDVRAPKPLAHSPVTLPLRGRGVGLRPMLFAISGNYLFYIRRRGTGGATLSIARVDSASGHSGRRSFAAYPQEVRWQSATKSASWHCRCGPYIGAEEFMTGPGHGSLGALALR